MVILQSDQNQRQELLEVSDHAPFEAGSHQGLEFTWGDLETIKILQVILSSFEEVGGQKIFILFKQWVQLSDLFSDLACEASLCVPGSSGFWSGRLLWTTLLSCLLDVEMSKVVFSRI